jgi:hypothetical protein
MRDSRALVLLVLLAVAGCGGGSGRRAADDRPAPLPTTPPSADPLRWVQKDLRRYVGWSPDRKGDHTCGVSYERYEVYSGLSATRGATCRQGLRVVARFDRHEGRTQTADCYRNLCAPPGTRFGAFACTVRLIGDSVWSVVCRDGARRVTFGRAD